MNKLSLTQNQTARQFIKFAVVGTVGTAEDWLIYLSLTRLIDWFGAHYLWAKAISFVVAATSNYIFNRIWTFRSAEQRIARQFGQFFAVSVVGAAINLSVMYLMVSRLGFFDVYGLIVATAAALFWNFFANKYWTFKE